MKQEIKCVLLIDDDKVTNFYNTKIVNKHEKIKEVVAVTSGEKALEYLKEAISGLCLKPNLIFLDINMPAMNGWEFVVEYNKLDQNFTKDIKLVMLTTSNNPDDFERSKQIVSIDDFINKPLSVNLLTNLLENYYKVKTY
ncbi:response regulator [Olleya sp. YS]|uniref:response regulator n=1 Tax=Olleya sp. YS TaxID=3028318 RepID=UPI0024341014|nr:response regulator [Olleya sp. YS]WGD34271.1 response regulator [Olleya sp. YS]